jgi:DNA repair exonuclease SbcCD ATPase subunit
MQEFIRGEKGITALKKILADGSQLLGPTTDRLREKIQSFEKQLSVAEQRCDAAENAHAELAQTKQRLREKDQELLKSHNAILGLERRVSELEKLILRTCPECGEEFRIGENLIKTSWFDGSFRAFRCPNQGCQGVVPPEVED